MNEFDQKAQELFSEITLMDSSREMLKMAEQKMEAADLLKFKTRFFNLEQEKYVGNTFDIIYSQMVLHHIKDINDILQKFSVSLGSVTIKLHPALLSERELPRKELRAPLKTNC